MNKDIVKIIIVVVVSLVAVFAICRIIKAQLENNKGWGKYSTKLVGITFIVAMAIIAYIYDASNSSSVFALLGTLAGYFLGSQDADKQKNGDINNNEQSK